MPPEVRRTLTYMAALALFWRPSTGFATTLVFAGGLQRVGHESISIKLADRRLITARLPNSSRLAAGSVAGKYQIGDQVQITCEPIRPVWDEEAFLYQSLEVTKLRFVRPPSREELSEILASRPWRGAVNLLRHPAGAVTGPAARASDPQGTAAGGMDAQAAAKLQHAREVNLASASNMPNFVADETAKRYTSHGGTPQWRSFDSIESEIAFKGNRAVRQHVRRDGQALDQPFQALPGFRWYGGFGTEIRPLFDPLCPNTVAYEGQREVRGRQVLVYRFSSPPDGCFGPFTAAYQRYNPARAGHVFIEDPGGSLIQFDEEASGFPAEFDFVQRKEEVSWDWVKIGDALHLLPVRADFVVLYATGDWWRVEVEYTNHRHFEAASRIAFQ